MKKQGRNIKHSPIVKFASIVASAILVLNLLPVQGIAEARDELANAMTQPAQEQTQNNAPTTNQAQTPPAKTPTTMEAPSVEEGKPEGGEQNNNSGEAEPVEGDDESDLGSEAPAHKPADNELGTNEVEQVTQSAEVATELTPTSANLAEFLTEATIEGAQVADGATNVTEGTPYNVRLAFAERADMQFADGEELTFALPAEFSPAAEQKALTDPVVVRYVDEKGAKQEFALGKNAWRVDGDNVLHFAWRQTDDGAQDGQAKNNEANFKRLASLANATFELKVKGTFAPNAGSVDFGRGPITLNFVAKPAEKPVDKDAAATSQQNANKPAADQPKQGEEKKPAEDAKATKTKYAYEDDDVRVVATLSEASAVPDNAKLRVTPVAQGDEGYDAYLRALNATSPNRAEHSADNTLLYDVAFVVDGEEVQPAEGTVQVSFQFKRAQLADQLDAQKRSKVDVTHLPKVDGEPVAEPVDAKVSVERETADFTAKGFSVYAFSYTVDFTFGGYAYKMPGEGSVMLSSLLMALGINRSVVDVAKVEFSDPALLSVVKVDNNWRLTSLKSFTTSERLTVTMVNGDKFEIDVTDPPAPASTNLSDYLTNAAIDAPIEDGKYKVSSGTAYKVHLYFKETANRQFPNGGTMTYTLPAGLTGDGQQGTCNIRIGKADGTSVNVPGNQYSIQNGVLTFTWSTEPSISDVYATNNVNFQIEFAGTIDENAKQLRFGDNVVKEILVDNSSSVTASKVGSVAGDKKSVEYTVNVQSKGASTNVAITDTIRGTGVTLRANSVQATSSTWQPVSLNGLTYNGNRFDCTIPSMSDGEIVTLKYTADLDPSQLDLTNGVVTINANNEVKVHNQFDPTDKTVSVTNKIEYKPGVSKLSVGKTSSEGKDIVTWKTVVNPNPQVSYGGGTVTDTIDSNSQQYLKFSGSGISIAVKDEAGNDVRTDTKSWAELGVDTASATSFSYTIPDTDKGHVYSYEITYTTDADTSSLSDSKTVANTANNDNGETSTGTVNIGPVVETGSIKKTFESLDRKNKTVSWRAVIEVPEAGLSQAVVTDTYPNQWLPSGIHAVERVKEGTVQISGDDLQEGEHYEIAYGDAAATITFYKTAGTSSPGLNGAAGGRTITVTLQTEVSDDWLDASDNEAWRATHENNINLNGKVSSTAQTNITNTNVKKSVEAAGTRKVNNVDLPIYKYTVMFTGVDNTDQQIKDTFDTSLLEPYVPSGSWDAFYLQGGNLYYQGYSGANPVSYLNTSDGMTLQTNAASMPMDNGRFYDAYKLVYYLTVKDEAALQTIMGKAARSEGGVYNITNSVDMNGKTATSVIPYVYEGLKKEILTSDYELSKTDEEIYANFRITVNPGNQLLNGGEPITLTDKYRNLSVIYDSVKVTPSENVTYDFTGHMGTYVIPDGKKVVIEYRARVIRSTNDTQAIVFDNLVEMPGYHDEVTKTAHYTSNAAGGGEQYAINLLKYEAGDMTNTLGGAKFELWKGKFTGYDDEGKPTFAIDQPVKNNNNETVTFTTPSTGEDRGKITVYGDEQKDGWSLYAWADTDVDNARDNVYYLKEVEAPANYMLSDFNYEFRISGDGTTDYDNYLYHAGDTMSAKNYPGANVLVEKSWSGYEPDDDDEVVVRLQQKIGAEGTWSNTIRRMVDGQWTEVGSDSEPVTITLNKANKWKAAFPGLPLDVPIDLANPEVSEDVRAFYQIKEYKVNGTNADVTVTNDATDGNNADWHWHYSGGAQNAYTITNSPKVGSLKLKKLVTVNGAEPIGTLKNRADATYYFNVVGPYREGDTEDTERDQTSVSFTIKNGEIDTTHTGSGEDEIDNRPTVNNVPVDLVDGYVTINNLKPGTYRIYEDMPSNGMAPVGFTKETVDGFDYYYKEVQVNYNEAATCDATNNIDLGNIQVTKKATLNDSDELNAAAKAIMAGTYTFTLYRDEACTDPVTHEVDSKQRALTTTVVIGEDGTATPGSFDNLPVGTYYVKESVPETAGWAPKTNPIRVEVTRNQTVETLDDNNKPFTNNLVMGQLKITKNVTINGKTVADAVATGIANSETVVDGEYRYQVRKDSPDNPIVANMRLWIKNGEVADRVWVKQNEDKTFTEVATEDEAKDLNGKQIAAYPKIYTKTAVEGISPSDSGWYIRHVAPGNDGYITIPDLEPGTYYIREVENYGIMTDPTIELANSTIANGGTGNDGTKTGLEANDRVVKVTAGETAIVPDIAFTNNKTETSGFELSKKVISKSISQYVNTPFTFRVELYKDAACTELATEINTDDNHKYGQMAFVNGVAQNVVVRHNETLATENLPTGLYYKITEADPGTAGFELKGITINSTNAGTTAATGIITKTPPKVEFTNERYEGNLKVQKIVPAGYAPDQTKKFTFTVTLDNTTINGTYGTAPNDMTFENGVATFQLAAGEWREAVQLPAGVGYTVSETNEAGFTCAWTGTTSDGTDSVAKDNPTTGIIAKGITETVTATNTRIYGKLEVSKKVVSNVAEDATKDFGFTATLYTDAQRTKKADISGELGTIAPGNAKVSFNNGVANFTLKADQKVTFDNLPYGLYYTVSETDAQGLALQGSTDRQGTIATGTASEQFTNTHTTGGIVVTKHVTSDVPSDKTKKFSYRITLTDTNNNPLSGTQTFGGVTFTKGEYEFQLANNETATFTGIDDGYHYKVEERLTESEIADNVYKTSLTNGNAQTEGTVTEGAIQNATINVVYTNERTKGDLEVSKKLVSDRADDKNRDFAFTVTLYSDEYQTVAPITDTFGDMSFTNGVATFSLKGGQKATATGLPQGIHYKVTEAASTGFATDIANDGKGAIAANTLSSVEATNTRDTGDLKLEKTLVSDAEADKDVEFTFTVTLSDKTINKTYGDMAFTGGVATVKLKGARTVTATGLPTDIGYTITEVNASGFELQGITVNNAAAATAEGTISTTRSDVNFTNKRKSGGLTVSKTLVSDAAADKDVEFTFTVALDGLTAEAKAKAGNDAYDVTYAGSTRPAAKLAFTDGSAQIRLKGGESATITGLPTDVSYTVTEAATPGFTAVGSTSSTGVVATTPKVNPFTNKRDLGNLELCKKVVSDATGDASVPFNFTVTLYKQQGGEVDTTINKKYGDIQFTQGVGHVTLVKDQVATATDLPQGLYYEVTEDSHDTNGFKLTNTTGNQGSITATKAYAEFTNTRDTGGLKVSKRVVSSNPEDLNKEFTFTVKLIGAPVTGLYDKVDATDTKGMSFTEGVATITLKNGETASAKGLPLGVSYTVTEDTELGFTTTSDCTKDIMLIEKKSGFEGTISDSAEANAFLNTHDEGKLTVQKIVESDYAPDKDPATQFDFRVALDDKTFAGNYGVITRKDGSTETVSFAGGVATFKLADTDVFTATGLPANMGYTVNETNVDGFEAPSWTSNTGTRSQTSGTIKRLEDLATEEGNVHTVTNKRLPAKLEVSKYLISHTDRDYSKFYTFELFFYTDAAMTQQATELSGTYRVGTRNPVNFSGGYTKFALYHTETMTIENLPRGLYYKIVELDANQDGFVTDVSGETGQLTQSKLVRYTNTRTEGGLYVYKSVESPLDADGERQFEFEVTIYSDAECKNVNTAIDGYYGNENTNDSGGMTFYEGKATFTLGSGETAFAFGLPEGNYYKVKEKSENDFTTTIKTIKPGAQDVVAEANEATGQIVASQSGNVRVEYKNARKRGNLEVGKKVVNGTPKENEEFSIKVELDDKTISGTFGDMTFNDGVAEFTLKAGETKSTANKTFQPSEDGYCTLPVGIGYRVTESHANGYIASWTNTTYANDAAGTQPTTFSYAYAQDWDHDASYIYHPKTETRTITWTDGTGEHTCTDTHRLAHQESYWYEGDEWEETGYGELESWTKGDSSTEWSWKADGNDDTTYTTGITAGNTDNVTFTNKPELGDLPVTKTVNSLLPSDHDKLFHFVITLSDTSVNGDHGDMTFANGVAEVDLKADETKVARDLPKGVRYTVRESAVAGFYGDPSNTDGIIGYGVDGEVELCTKEFWTAEASGSGTAEASGNDLRMVASYNNRRQTGKLKVAKSVTATNPDPNKTFHFKVTLYTDSAMQNQATGINGTLPPVETLEGETETLEGETFSYCWYLNQDGTINYDGYREMTREEVDARKVTVTNGVIEFYLKDGEDRFIGNLPAGLTYKVEETNADGYTTTWTGQTGTITGEGSMSDNPGSLASASNTRIEGGLTVSKKVVSDRAADKNTEFRFEIQLTKPAGLDEPISGTFGDMTFDSGGKAVVVLKDGQSATARGLPVGVAYTVTEVGIVQNDEDGEHVTEVVGFQKGFTNSKNTGTIVANETDAVESVNTREKGNLSVTKDLRSDRATDADVEFKFTVTLDDPTINGTYGDMTFASGVATVFVKKDVTKTATDLPTDVKYTVTEEAVPEFEIKGTTVKEGSGAPVAGNTGVIKKDGSLVTVSNDGRRGKIKVSKEVVSNAAIDKQADKKFNFTLTLSDTSINGSQSYDGQAYGVSFSNGVANFTLAHDQEIWINNLPVDVTYTITEGNTPGFTLTGRTGYTGKINSNPDGAQAKFTNTRDEGDLEISKTIISSDDTDQNIDFKFNVQLYTDAARTQKATITAGTYGDVTFDAEGHAEVTVESSKGQTTTKVARGLPTGLYYTVTEAMTAEQANKFKLTGKVGDQGSITSETSTASFTNTHLPGGLQIYKYVDSPTTTDRNKQYTFRVTIPDSVTDMSGVKAMVDNTEVQGFGFDSNHQATISLKHDQTATITGLPSETHVKVEEVFDQDADGAKYTTKRAVGDAVVTEGRVVESVEIPPNDSAYVRFSNERKTGDLKLTKQLVSTSGKDSNQEFTFTVQLDDEGVSGTFKSSDPTSTAKPMTFTGGKATVTLKKGEIAEADGLPQGVKCTITENDVTGFQLQGITVGGTAVNGNKAEDTIGATESDVVFTNERDTGNLVLKKTVNGPNNENKAFAFTVTLADRTVNGTFGKMDGTDHAYDKTFSAFTNGVATVTLLAGETASAKGLPIGDYAITEADAPGFTVASTNSTGAITKGATVTSEFTNTRPETEVSIKKVWDKNQQNVALPGSVSVKLLADGTERQTVTLAANTTDAAKNWAETISGLPRYNTTDGKEIAYTWDEDVPRGWTLSGTAKSGALTTITNTYTYGELQLSGKKAITNKPDSIDLLGYKFTVKEGNDVVATGESNATGDITFTTIAYTAEGVHTYTVTEDATPTKDGVANSTTPVTVKVSVTNDGKGHLIAKASNDSPAAINAINFTNTYSATGTAQLSAKKSNTNAANLGNRKFTFELLNVAGSVLQTSSEVTAGESANFAPISYSLADLGSARSKDFTYQIREVVPADAKTVNGKRVKDGVTYDTKVVNVKVTVSDNGNGTLSVKYDGKDTFTTPEFENDYAATAELPLSGSKVMDGRDFRAGDTYTFTVTADPDTAPLPENSSVTINPTSGNTAALDFGKLSYTLADAGKTYTYTITEAGTVDGVAIAAAKTFSVKVTDNGDGTLKLEEGDEAITTKTLEPFTNVFTPARQELKVTKNFNDWSKVKRFEFTLTAGDNTAGPNVATPMPAESVNNTKNAYAYESAPTASFGTIAYDRAGTYHYTVAESNDGIAGVTYDPKTYQVTVEVTKNQQTNALSATVTHGTDAAGMVEGDTIAITNTYASGKATLQATKQFKDWGQHQAEEFEFVLTRVDNAPMPIEAGTNDSLVKKATRQQSTAVFGEIAYQATGVYKYTIAEVKGSEDAINYDTAVHDVTVTVTKDPTTNAFVADVKYDGAAALTITNTSKPSFDKKIADINDSTDTKAGTWQDSADYDIGDAVPYRLKATLPDDVTSYKKYHLTFTDKMEESLTFNEGSVQVKVNNVELAKDAYTVTKTDDQNFTVRVDWAGMNGATIADATLNDANVEVFFNATLNSNAQLGKTGNVNAAKLAFSNMPSDDTGEHEAELPWDYVIAFTYKTDVSKVDPSGATLAGAEFKLEKKFKVAGTNSTAATEEWRAVDVSRLANGTGDARNVFTATGLDDGTYRLTETKIPYGFKLIEPIEFVVTADHKPSTTWDYTTPANADPVFDADGTKGSNRLQILSDLTGNEETGTLKLAKDESLSTLSSNVANEYAKGTGEIKVQKLLVGREWKTDDHFDFTLTAGTNDAGVDTPMPASTNVSISNTDAKTDYTKSFGAIEFSRPGTYTYVVEETEGDIADLNYDWAEHEVAITVVPSADSRSLVASTESNLVPVVKVSNEVKRGHLVINKTVRGPELNEEQRGQISFMVRSAAGVVMTPGGKPITLNDFKVVEKGYIGQDGALHPDPEYGGEASADTQDSAKTTKRYVSYEWATSDAGIQLPIGDYNVQETNSMYGYVDTRTYVVNATDKYSDEQGGAKATVHENETVQVAVTDTLEPSTLVVAKKLVDGSGKETTSDQTFTFTVRLEPENPDLHINTKLGDMEFKDNVATFSLKGGESATSVGLPIGCRYTVTEEPNDGFPLAGIETNDASQTSDLGTRTATGTISKTEAKTYMVSFTNTITPDKPTFEKKIKDTNDTTGETSDWQDSADYDIGDAVPYRLTATLASNVTSYKKYHVTFTDKMEDSLTFNYDAAITVTGADGTVIDPSAYTVDKVAENDHDFVYKISWAGVNDATIADANLNGATVEVLFTATLNDKAKLGKEGNVNACKLAYSNNPVSADDSDEGELPWDYVIAHTYKLDVSKVDAEANPLEGAEFKLWKKLADGESKEVKLSVDKNVFTATGLDDGTYVLSESVTPVGYKAIEPIEFAVTADHNAAWDYTSDAAKDPDFSPDSRAGILTKLTGDEKTGALTLKADEQLTGLAGNVVNQPTNETSPKDDGNKSTPANSTTTSTTGRTTTTGTTLAKTGDDTPMAAMLACAATGIAAILYARRRRT